MIPFPDKKYDIIYADPPWGYKHRWFRRAGNTGKPIDKSVCDHYPLLTFETLKEMPVNAIAADNCLLFMWVVSPKLYECIETGIAWGFKYSTVGFVWHKNAQPVLGTYTHSECEMCLIFKKGKIPQPRGKRNITQFLSCRRGKHSGKPDEVRHRITEMFPTQSKIELFARVNGRLFPPMEGWDYWGNEA